MSSGDRSASTAIRAHLEKAEGWIRWQGRMVRRQHRRLDIRPHQPDLAILEIAQQRTIAGWVHLARPDHRRAVDIGGINGDRELGVPAEYHSGYMLYARKTIASIPFRKLSDSFDFDLEMIVMAHIGNLRIAEIAIQTIYAGEVSHLKPVQYGLRVLGIVANYKRGKYDKLTR